MEKSHKETISTTPHDNVLICDGLNTYIRGFSVNPVVNDDGIHIGGIVAFLNSLGYAIRLIKPTRCIVVFDGVGGSQRRRKLYPEYKSKRKPTTRFNRQNVFLSYEDEKKSMAMQLKRLIDYIDYLPITYFTIDNIEADDTIAYLAKDVRKDIVKKSTIMSTDKDFLQLIDDRIQVYNPFKKKLYTDSKSIIEDFNVPLENYLLYRMIIGDTSDNIKNITGIKDKTLRKIAPILFETKSISVDELLNYCEEQLLNKEKSKIKALKILSESRENLELNYKLMNLTNIDISASAKSKIRDIFDMPIHRLNRILFQKLTIEDKLYAGIPNVIGWLVDTFSSLDMYSLMTTPTD